MKEIALNDFSPDFVELFEQIDNQWLNSLPSIISYVCKKENFTIEYFLQNSRFGCIAAGTQNGCLRIIKFVDTKIEKYLSEIEVINILKYPFLNHVYSSSKELGYYISDYCESSVSPNNNLLETVMPLFKQVLKTCAKYEKEQTSIKSYKQKLITKKQDINNNYNNAEINLYLDDAITMYNRMFEKEELFILHGDLHEKNIMKKNNKLVCIDPIGVIAPIEFEYTRFIENQIFLLGNTSDFEKKAKELIKSITNIGIHNKKLRVALYIDCILRTSSSVQRKEGTETISLGLINIKKLRRIIEEDG